MAPKVSVVIPTHGGRFLPAAVRSVQAQTVDDWELIIVDDGSTDGTADVAARFAAEDPRIRVVTHPRNSGIAAARNRGFGAIAASAEHVAFLDHDDVWMPDALEALRAELRARPAAAAAHGRAIEIDEHGAEIPPNPAFGPWRRLGVVEGRLVEWPAARPTEFANLAYGDCIVSTGSGLIRRTDLVGLGGFDLRAEPADDYDLWIRLVRRGEIGFVDRVVLGYRLHDTRRSLRPPPPRGRGTPYVQYKMITCPENSDEQRRAAIAGFRARQRQLLARRLAELSTAWRSGAYRELSRRLVGAAAPLAAYARGRPWSWHR